MMEPNGLPEQSHKRMFKYVDITSHHVATGEWSIQKPCFARIKVSNGNTIRLDHNLQGREYKRS